MIRLLRYCLYHARMLLYSYIVLSNTNKNVKRVSLVKEVRVLGIILSILLYSLLGNSAHPLCLILLLQKHLLDRV